jgi:hypothetical protein
MREQRQSKKPRVENNLKPSASQQLPKSKLLNKKNPAEPWDGGSFASSAATSVEATTPPLDEIHPHQENSRIEALHHQLITQRTPRSSIVDIPTNSLEFNPIQQTEISVSEELRLSYQKKKGGSKKQRLEKLLKEAEKKRERLKTFVQSDDQTLQAKAKAEQWNDVMAAAAGEKTLQVSSNSNTSTAEIRIKKALKRKEKMKEKSAREWSDRLHNLNEDQQLKIKQKQENLQKKKLRHLGGEIVKNNEKAEGKEMVKTNNGVETNHNNSHHHKNKNNNELQSFKRNGKQQSNEKKNRAGFEGKKREGSYLNGHKSR